MAAKSIQMNLYGVQLSNRELITEENLSNQIVMILEILTDYNNRMDVMNRTIIENKDELSRKISETNEQVHKMKGQLKKVEGEVVKLRSDLETTDQSLRRLDNRVTQMKDENDQKFKELGDGLREARAIIDDHAPRLESVEQLAAKNKEDIKAGVAMLTRKIEELDDKTDKRFSKVEEHVEGVDGRLTTLERKFKEADIEGLTRKVNEATKKIAEHDVKHEEHYKEEKRLEDTCKQLRNDVDAIRPYCDETFATKVTVSTIHSELKVEIKDVHTEFKVFSDTVIRSYLTKNEFSSLQDEFHTNIVNHMSDELLQQREEIYDRISAVQERFSAELEEVAKSDDWQTCVTGLQKLMEDVEGIGKSVTDHGDAIDRAAVKYGATEKEVEALKGGMLDVGGKVDGVLESFSEKVKAVIKEVGGDKIKTKDEKRGKKERPISGGGGADSLTSTMNQSGLVESQDYGGGMGGGGGGGDAYGGAGGGMDTYAGHAAPRSPQVAPRSPQMGGASAGAVMAMPQGMSAEETKKWVEERKEARKIARTRSAASRASGEGEGEGGDVGEWHGADGGEGEGGGGGLDGGGGGGSFGPIDTQGIVLDVLAELQGTISDQMEGLRARIFTEFVPRRMLDDAVKGVTRKMAEFEFKVLRQRLEVTSKDAEYNDNLMGMDTPFLTTAKHPAIARPQTAGALNGPPNSRNLGLPLDRSGQTLNYFESSEMRAALHDGTPLRTKGSMAAVRIFRRNATEPELEPVFIKGYPELTREITGEEVGHLRPNTAGPLPGTAPRITMLPRIDADPETSKIPSDGTHPWQMKPSAKASSSPLKMSQKIMEPTD